jgi:hypothetical protein
MENKTYTISWNDTTTLINMVAYEDYARVYRRLHHAGLKRRPTFEEFVDNCPVHDMLDSFSEEMWHRGYEFIADLFDDNEKNETPCDEEAKFNQNVAELLMMFNNRK